MLEFLKHSINFARNPLGIIALFISLIYGFACLVVTSEAADFEYSLLAPLVWFLVVFPVLVLVAFVYLVSKHHTKLYAPSDFKDENNFWKPLTTAKINERLTDEAILIDENYNESEISQETIQDDEVNNQVTVSVPSTSKVENDSNHKAIILPEKCNKKNTPNEIEKREKYFNNVKNEYFLIEELAIRKVASELNAKIDRHVQINFANGVSIETDGVSFIKNKLYLFEVKYIKGDHISSAMIQNIRRIIERAETVNDIKTKFVLIVVHDSKNGEDIKKKIQEFFPPQSGKYQFKFFNFDNLTRMINN
jgi:hypothetical protein